MNKRFALSASIMTVLVMSIAALTVHMSVSGRATLAQKYQGFSSYDEMMKAHHGSGGGGCGMSDSLSGNANLTGEMMPYGITLDTNGYNQLLKDDAEIKLTQNQLPNYIGLNILLPCCGVATLQASDNCQCGHHVALSGLAKRMITQNYSKEQVQQEIDRWKLIFYPNGTESGAGSCSV